MSEPTPQRASGFRILRLYGIDVRVHWSWLLTLPGLWLMPPMFASRWWLVALDVALFAMVIVHEFGHALACRMVGGQADRILLWPLGGLAFVRPPRRPGAVLWTMAAGPLTNVALLAPTLALVWLVRPVHSTLPAWNAAADPVRFILFVAILNFVLLVFNLLPIYPLDGGRILQALLWYIVGEGPSLVIASAIGLLGATAMAVAAAALRDYLLGVLVVLGLWRSWVGLQAGLQLVRLTRAPRRADMACPHCGIQPIIGPAWVCHCGQRYDAFAQRATCPACGQAEQRTQCPDCLLLAPIEQWRRVAPPAPDAPPALPLGAVSPGVQIP